LFIRSIGLTILKHPPNLPMGVLTALTMTTFLIDFLLR
jgi:hypothetical protein